MTHTRKTLAELSVEDQGATITMTGGEATITGVLRSFEVESEWIDITSFGNEGPDQIRGQRTVTIHIGHWTAEDLPPDTTVEVFR